MKQIYFHLALACLIFGAGQVLAQAAAEESGAVSTTTVQAPPPLELRKTGVVNVVKDAEGKVASIKLVVTSYEIILDDKGLELAEKDGQKVRVIGTFSMQDNKRCFTVKSIEALASEESKPAAAPEPTEK